MSERSPFFTSGEAQQLVGITQRQLTYWNESALIRPHGRTAHGRGSRRLYTMLDLVQLKIIRRLRETGVPLQRIRQALGFLADWPDEPAPLGELVVLTDGSRILVQRSDDQLVDPIAKQFVLQLPLATLLAEVRAGVLPQPFAERQTMRDHARFGTQSSGRGDQ